VEVPGKGKPPLDVSIVFGLVHAVVRLLNPGADVKKTAIGSAEDRKKAHKCDDCIDSTLVHVKNVGWRFASWL